MLDTTLAADAAGAFAAGTLTFLRLGFKSLLSLLDRLPVESASALLACRQASRFAAEATSPAYLGRELLSLKHAAFGAKATQPKLHSNNDQNRNLSLV